MADYSASKNPLPSASAAQQAAPEYIGLLDLKELAKGLSLAQGQADIYGVIEMIGALHHHYLRFVDVRTQKIRGKVDIDAPDDRFEAVAYINRIGQLHYFSTSEFVLSRLGAAADTKIPSVSELVPFRHKYTAHRARDKPKSGEENDLSGETALGSLGGHSSVERELGAFLRIPPDLEWNDKRQKHFEQSYTLYNLFCDKGLIEFNLERDHPKRLAELFGLVRSLLAVRLP